VTPLEESADKFKCFLEEELKKFQKEKHNPNLTLKDLFDTPTLRPLVPKLRELKRLLADVVSQSFSGRNQT